MIVIVWFVEWLVVGVVGLHRRLIGTWGRQGRDGFLGNEWDNFGSLTHKKLPYLHRGKPCFEDYMVALSIGRLLGVGVGWKGRY